MTEIPVLEIGGTHVSAAVIDTSTWRPVRPATRRPLQADGSREEFLAAVAGAAAHAAPERPATWGVAMPDPFDYARGIALFAGVGKFDALYGLDVGAAFARRLGAGHRFAFLNDADAFTLGEWAHGAGAGAGRCAGLTLGTGVGSGWVVDGRIVAEGPGVPPGGRAHRLSVDGVPLEDVMSRRAILAAHRASGGAPSADVADVAEACRAGDAAATAVLRTAVSALGTALGPCVRRFGADVLVVGGSMAGSWDLFEPWFREAAPGLPPVRPAADPEGAALTGAALHALASA
ncbi:MULTISPECIES: ROK family protein [Actinomadura]|uniref:ROK family protein n=1 Tax=Actinomadura yumaensis TaxID=111807 RepID=A0ABW2CVR2_9ACTN|nr:ROK family protein [Actinomadura sp. J1-007]